MHFTSPAITTAQAIAHAQRAFEILGIAAATAGAAAIEYGPKAFEWAAVRTIAAGIVTIRAGRDFRASKVWRTVSAVATLAWMIAIALMTSAAVSAYRFLAPIVREQWVIQVADLCSFHRAVSGVELKRYRLISAEIDAVVAAERALKAELEAAL